MNVNFNGSKLVGKRNVNAMDINSEKAILIKEIEQLQDISLVRVLKSMLHYGLKNEGRISVELYNRELEEADAEIENGDFLTHEDAVKEVRSWRE
jgi:hypothetical protein